MEAVFDELVKDVYLFLGEIVRGHFGKVDKKIYIIILGNFFQYLHFGDNKTNYKETNLLAVNSKRVSLSTFSITCKNYQSPSIIPRNRLRQAYHHDNKQTF